MEKKKIADGVEKLTAYMLHNDLSANELATRCRLNVMTILRVLHGFPMRKRTAMRINKGTRGEIKFSELCEEKVPSKYRSHKYLKDEDKRDNAAQER